jgi:hypothetical protein
VATEFRTLPEELKTVAPFAWTCTFDSIENKKTDGMLEECLFEENAFFQVQVMGEQDSGKQIVRLLQNNRNILDFLNNQEEKMDTDF